MKAALGRREIGFSASCLIASKEIISQKPLEGKFLDIVKKG